jgi:hypothetical protein
MPDSLGGWWHEIESRLTHLESIESATFIDLMALGHGSTDDPAVSMTFED